jgi:hypothetical protein
MTRKSPRNPEPTSEDRQQKPEPPVTWKFTDWASI